MGQLMSSIALFRKEVLQIFVGAFLLAFHVGGWNILDSVMYRTIEFNWNEIDLLASIRLS